MAESISKMRVRMYSRTMAMDSRIWRRSSVRERRSEVVAKLDGVWVKVDEWKRNFWESFPEAGDQFEEIGQAMGEGILPLV